MHFPAGMSPLVWLAALASAAGFYAAENDVTSWPFFVVSGIAAGVQVLAAFMDDF